MARSSRRQRRQTCSRGRSSNARGPKQPTSRAVFLEGKAGSAIYLHGIAPHASAPNHSSKPRTTLIMAYRAADAFPIHLNKRTAAHDPHERVVRGQESLVARFGQGSFPNTLERFCPITKHGSGRGDCEDGGGLDLEKGKGLTPMERLYVSPSGPDLAASDQGRVASIFRECPSIEHAVHGRQDVLPAVQFVGHRTTG